MSQHLDLNNETQGNVPCKLAPCFPAQDSEQAFSLSPTQAGMFFHSLFAPDAGLYLEQILLRIDGELNVQQFESSWQRVVEHHEILRTSFRWQDQESPVQVVHRQVTLPFQKLDWRNLAAVDQEKDLQSFLAADRRTGFEFAQPPLMRLALIRLSSESYRLIWTNHHALLDGWSQSLILKQVFSVYRALRAGQKPILEPGPSFRNYLDWLETQDFSEAGPFWKQTLKGFTAPTPLGVDRSTSDSRNEVRTHEEFGLQLSSEATAELQAFARQNRLTMFTLVQGAWALLLSRYSGMDDVAFGATVSVRPFELLDIESAAGLFINTIPVRTRVDSQSDVISWLKDLQLDALEAREHQHTSLADIQRWSEVPNGSPLFESILVFENYPTEAESRNLGDEVHAQQIHANLSRTNYPLTLLAFPGQKLQLTVVCDSERFDEQTIRRMLRHLQTILAGMVAAPSGKLADLSLLTADEQEQILFEWNRTGREYEKDLCVYHLFERQAALTPEAIAVEFDHQTLTYRELNARANRLAHYLRNLGVGAESLVGICVERSLEMMVGLLGILKAGGAYVPLDPAFPSERLAFMIEDANVPLLLTQQKLVSELPQHQAKLVCIDSDWELIARESAENSNHDPIGSDHPAYLIYTSGSTGKPKGVEIGHRALTNFLCSVSSEPGLTANDVLLSVTTLSFDIAALELYLPLIVGARLVIVSRDVASDGNKLKERLAQTGATVVQATPATWRMLIDAGWQGSGQLKVLCGGESLSRALADQLLQRSNSVWNMYGPTETTIWSTLRRVGAGDGPVSIGRPLANTQVYLLDQNRRPVPIGVAGELHIGGDGLARGYLKRPELTSEKFIPNPFNGDPEARLYKTGDLARYLPDGNIECLGRIDDQVKLRGFRIELGEIEAVLRQHEAVRESVVVAREDVPGDRRLVAYVVPAAGFTADSKDLRAFLQDKLPEYMIPSVVVELHELPLTPNGKVNRRALPAPDYDAQLQKNYVAPRTPTEELLCGIWAEVLKVSRVGVDDNFFELGGHSLLATQVVSRIVPAFNVQLPLRTLFEAPTVAGMAERVEALRLQSSTAEASSIPRTARDGSAPLSFGQQSFWFLDSLTPNTSLYNIFRALRLRGRLEVSALRQALDGLMARHESLRTVFASVNGQPVQVVLEHQKFQLSETELVDLPAAARERELQKLLKAEVQVPFDLAHGPLVRATLFRLDAEENVLLLSMHHIVADDWSMGIFSRELEKLYNGFVSNQPFQFPELPIQYADFAQWQHAASQKSSLETQLQYWKQQLAGAPPLLELPTDRPRPSGPTFHGAHHALTLPVELRDQLVKLSQREGVSLFMVLLAAFQALLAQYSGQDDIVVGSPIAGRNRLETENLIGHFINTLVLRTLLSGDPTFSELLGRVRDVALGAYAHQDTPFEKLVEELQPERNLSYTPLFQVMFVFQNAWQSELNLSGLEITTEELHNETAPLDLTLEARETAEGVRCVFEYKTDLFDNTTVERIAERFQLLLEKVVVDPAQNMSSISPLTESERTKLLVDWNNTSRDYPRHFCVQQLFETQVEQTPDAVAVVFQNESLTYRELNKRANQLAHHLRAGGVGAESLVGLCVERSIEMVVGVLGILKAGGAYVPLDPNHPRARLNLILADAGVSLVLSQAKVSDVLSEFGGTVLRLDADWQHIVEQNTDNPLPVTTAESLAYVIFTSGSTGTPKGVMITQRSLVNFTINARGDYALSVTDRVLQFASLSFDTSAEEIFPCLTSGATLVLRTEEMLNSVSEFLQTCDDWAITVLDLPTAYWHEIAAEFERVKLPLPEALRLLIIGGERALPERLSIWRQLAGSKIHLVNTYGPTEATIVATKCDISVPESNDSLDRLPIGRPLANTTIYLLDRELNLVPVGASGELHIGGDGLARGYLNQPELTSEKFIPNPFSDSPEARLYKTGDLARYLPDGNIEYLGRIDDQVKLRGFRIELGEIETALRQHSTVRDSVVVAREDSPGNKRLVAYLVPFAGAKIEIKELRAFLQGRLPEYMVPAAMIEMAELPLTPNGKLNRRALPAPDYDAQLQESYVAPHTPAEELLCGIWAEVLKVSRVGVNDNFFELGGHSLLATQVVSRVLQTFGEHVPLRALFEAPTVSKLAEKLGKLSSFEEAAPSSIVRKARQGVPPLSFAQQRLWFLEQLEGESGAYNISKAVRMTGRLNVLALRQTLSAIVARHESLRTNFELIGEEPVQTISAPREMEISLIDLRGQHESAVQQVVAEIAQHPFDLAHDRLLRASLLRLDDQEHVLLLTMHHIVSDGWSMSVLFREIGLLYEALVNGQPSPLAELPIQYPDFAVWQRDWLQGRELESQIEYWKKQLSGAPAVLELPTDRPRPPLQTFNGACHSIVLPQALTGALSELSRHTDTTLFMTLLAAFQALLRRYANQEDIVLGTPIANRTRRETEDLIGFFVNTLVIRTDLSGNPSFRELLRRVREVALQAYAHQDLPFEKLVEEIKPERNLSHMPLFQVMVVFQNAPDVKLTLPALELQEFNLQGQTSKVDLSLYIGQSTEGLKLSFEYNTDLFNATTIERMSRHFQTLLAAVIANPDQSLGELPLLDDLERSQLLQWADTRVAYPQGCIHQLFEEQATRSPYAIAVIYEDRQITFAELDARANQLANYLQRRGVGPESIVAVCMERSIETIVALLGILKAGAAFVPVDPSYPAERVAFLLEDSRASIVLTQQRVLDTLPASSSEAICLDARWAEIARESKVAPACAVTPENAAYLIYTSGSTGKPKGSVSPHRASLNRFAWMWRTFPFAAGEVCCQKTSLSFGDSIWEIFGPLLHGVPLVVIPDGDVKELKPFIKTLRSHGVTRLVLVPSLLRVLLEQEGNLAEKLPRLKHWTCSGEALPVDLARAFKQKMPASHLLNLYGSSEIAADVTYYEVVGPEQVSNIPIGRPIDNTAAYILDDCLELVPLGVCGELYIAGAGLARGYFDHPKLTAERFLPDPFSEPGARMFRTGDLARYQEDGTIEFLGRADYQVKIRGFRVELGEIETLLRQHASVRQSVVVAHEDATGDRRLVAYIVPMVGEKIEQQELRAFLQTKLPEYMTPSAIVEIEAFPLTPSGKVNRRALPAPEFATQLRKSYVAPRTEVEHVLSGIWAEVLRVPRVGVNDNFFELGGHSLLAVRLFARIEKQLGKHLPLATLFQAPTVGQLAQLVGDEVSTERWSSLVAIQDKNQSNLKDNGPKTPLFCVHAVGGNVLEYHDLARHLGPDQPFYAFQSVGLDGRQTPLKSIEEMAAHYIKEMRVVQPSGPYLLGGHSLGGMIAFEMACQLGEHGEQVDLLALLDSYPLGHFKLLPNSDSRTYLARRFAKRMKCHLDNLLQLKGKEKFTYLVNKAQFAPAKIKQQVWRKAYRLRRFNRALPATLRNIEGLNFLAARNYVPRIYPGRVALFWASGDLTTSFDLLDGWRTLAAGGVDVHEISGNHINIIQDPHVRELADELRGCLEQVQEAQSAEPARAA
jgi:amino acid adenylation domain-containing protein